MSNRRIRRGRRQRYAGILRRAQLSRRARHILAAVAMTGATLAGTAASTQADIINWQTNNPIPGTGAITPGPNLDLSNWNTVSHNLQFANLPSFDLHNTNFLSSWLDSARFNSATLTSVNFEGTSLNGADLTGATISSARFVFVPTLTQGQLASTASYQNHNLTGVALSYDTLTNWNLASQNLTSTNFDSATLTNVDFTSAQITYASFNSTTAHGFTAGQLYSTTSYQNHDLTGIRLQYNTLTSWNLASQNLSSANMLLADLSGADLSSATATGAILLSANLTGALLVGALLDDSYLFQANFTSADLRSADGRAANLGNATWTGADLDLSDLRRATSFNGGTGAASKRGLINPDGTASGFSLNSGETWLIRPDSQAVTVDGTIAVTGGSEVKIDGSKVGIQAGKTANWNLAAGGKVTLVAGPGSGAGPALLRVSSLQLAGGTNVWSSKLDMNDDKLIIDNANSAAAATTYTTVNNQIKQGFDNGAWDGQGIVSSKALTQVSLGVPATLGVINNDDGSGNPGFFGDGAPGHLPQFGGQSVNGTDVLAKYTYYGDADLSGTVDAVDYSFFVAGVQSGGALKGWEWGDFDYSGTIDAVDYSFFVFGVQDQGGPLVSAPGGSGPRSVPEPASLALLGVAGIVVMLRRGRK